MVPKWLSPLVIVPVLFLGACNPRAHVESARKTVEEFHRLYNANDFAALYRFTGSAVRSSTSLTDFVKYEQNVHTNLGELRSAEIKNYNILYLLRGPQVRLDYNSTFQNGGAIESFEINFRHNQPSIDGYRIDSPKLEKEK